MGYQLNVTAKPTKHRVGRLGISTSKVRINRGKIERRLVADTISRQMARINFIEEVGTEKKFKELDEIRSKEGENRRQSKGQTRRWRRYPTMVLRDNTNLESKGEDSKSKDTIRRRRNDGQS